MSFPSAEMYDGRLVADDAVKARLLTDLVVEADPDPPSDELVEPLVFIDTAGSSMFERSDADDSLHADSKSNENEATLVVRHVETLVRRRRRPLTGRLKISASSRRACPRARYRSSPATRPRSPCSRRTCDRGIPRSRSALSMVRPLVPSRPPLNSMQRSRAVRTTW